MELLAATTKSGMSNPHNVHQYSLVHIVKLAASQMAY